jgi:beta-1,2-mannosidase
MMYTAAEGVALPDVTAKLALATTKTPQVKSSWVRHGFVFPDIKSSKSGALLIRDEEGGPHYLIWGDNHLTLARSDDLLHFTNSDGPFISARSDHFDSVLVEAGPPPLKMADGNYLFFYNSARDFPSDKPGYAY